MITCDNETLPTLQPGQMRFSNVNTGENMVEQVEGIDIDYIPDHIDKQNRLCIHFSIEMGNELGAG